MQAHVVQSIRTHNANFPCPCSTRCRGLFRIFQKNGMFVYIIWMSFMVHLDSDAWLCTRDTFLSPSSMHT